MSSSERRIVTTPAAYEAAYRAHEAVAIPDAARLMGRIARYRPQQGEAFDRLAPDGRPIVFAMAKDGLEQLPGKPLAQALAAISIDPGYVQKKIAQGYQYELAVFAYPGTDSIEARRATWPNVLAEVARTDPRLSYDIERHAAELQEQPFSFYQEQLPEDMNDILDQGAKNKHFIGSEQYHALPETRRAGSLALRQLLACEYRLHPTFEGSGFTAPEAGAPALREYVLPNWYFDPTLPDAVTLPLQP